MIFLNCLIDPISDLISLMQRGSFKFLIASDLCINGVVPSVSILNPSHSMLCVNNVHFSHFMASPSSSNVFKTFITNLGCSSTLPTAAIKMSSR